MPHRVITHIRDGGVEDQHFGLFRHVGVDRVDVQVAKVCREPCLLRRGDRLVTEEQHRIVEQRLFNGVALFGIQRLGDIDAADLGAQGGA